MQLVALAFLQVLPVDDLGSRPLEERLDLFAEDLRLFVDELLDPESDGGKLRLWTHPVGRRARHPRLYLLAQAGDPDLEELVERLVEDGEELRPLEHRTRFLLCKDEHALAVVER